MNSASLHSFTDSDQRIGTVEEEQGFSKKYYPFRDSVVKPGGDYFENRGS